MSLDFAGLDAESAELDLLIDAAVEGEGAIGGYDMEPFLLSPQQGVWLTPLFLHPLLQSLRKLQPAFSLTLLLLWHYLRLSQNFVTYMSSRNFGLNFNAML